ncbi:MAG: amidohydrolase family protein [Hyphomonadaceae bacterium]
MKRLLALALWFFAFAPAAAQDEVFDLHVHIWNGAESVAAYEAQLRETGQSVTRFGAIHMAVQGRIEETRAKNDELLALAAAHPNLPIPSVHPYDGDAALDELRRLAARNVRAIKLHPHTQRFDVDDPRVRALCEEAGRLGIVVLIDNANIVPGDNQKLFNLAVAVPGTRFILTHMGGLEFRFWNLLALVRTTDGFFADNIYFDISATIALIADSPLEAEFVWTIRNVGVDHVLLGSDYPQMSLAEAVTALERLDLTPEERAQIRWGNAERLLLGDPLDGPARQSRQILRRNE